jgi:hypothetical protein
MDADVAKGNAIGLPRAQQHGADALEVRLEHVPCVPLRLLKKVQMQGGKRRAVRGVLYPYAAASRERANAADGSFSAAG